ncbi:hypothetical protein FRC17_004780 [Serendipita sp. 399]|nr:hypothetical protein FRC17_004780 [Serendipita sp. 399]
MPLPPSPVSLTFKQSAQGSETPQEIKELKHTSSKEDIPPVSCTFIFPNRRRFSRTSPALRAHPDDSISPHGSSALITLAQSSHPMSPPPTMESLPDLSSKEVTSPSAKNVECSIEDGHGRAESVLYGQETPPDPCHDISGGYHERHTVPTPFTVLLKTALSPSPSSQQLAVVPVLTISTTEDAASSRRTSAFSVSIFDAETLNERETVHLTPADLLQSDGIKQGSPNRSFDSPQVASTSISFSPSLQRAHKPAPLVLVPRSLKGGQTRENVTVQEAIITPGLETDSSFQAGQSPSPYRGVTSTIPAVDFAKGRQIELWIDQEDHRLIRATFKFKRHVPRHPFAPPIPRPSTARGTVPALLKDKDRFWESVTPAGLVDFRPSGKQIGTFNCGKTSRDAVIKRMILDGRDDKDYLSHNVILPLKENGVYVVYGFERERKRKGSNRVFVWKFEYTVEDKMLPHEGRQAILDEKLVRPVSFICSPELLAPSQRVTVSVMHLVGKKLTQNLKAQKIPPPALPPSLPTITVVTDYGTVPQGRYRKRNRISTAAKSLSRPTTPANDKRLRVVGPEIRCGSEACLVRPITSGSTSDLSHRDLKNMENPFPVETVPDRLPTRPIAPMNSVEAPVPRTPSLSLRGLMIGAKASSENLPHVTNRRRRASEASSQPLRTSLSALGIRQGLFGRPRSNSRPVTASARLTQNSEYTEPNRLKIEVAMEGMPATLRPSLPPWSIPTDDGILGTLHQMSRFVDNEQIRLETLSRSHRTKETTIERLDSMEDLRLDSEISVSATPHLKYPVATNPIKSLYMAKEGLSFSIPMYPSKRPATAPLTFAGSRTSSASQLSLQRPNFGNRSEGGRSDIEVRNIVPYNVSNSSLGYSNVPNEPQSSLFP